MKRKIGILVVNLLALLFSIIFGLSSIQTAESNGQNNNLSHTDTGSIIFNLSLNNPSTANSENYTIQSVQIPVTVIKNNPHSPLVCANATERKSRHWSNRYLFFTENHIDRLEPTDIKYPSHYFW
jgi:hypothetical protein